MRGPGSGTIWARPKSATSAPAASNGSFQGSGGRPWRARQVTHAAPSIKQAETRQRAGARCTEPNGSGASATIAISPHSRTRCDDIPSPALRYDGASRSGRRGLFMAPRTGSRHRGRPRLVVAVVPPVAVTVVIPLLLEIKPVENGPDDARLDLLQAARG